MRGNSDPIRIIEAVTAGVAFLAAGAIIQSRSGGVQGLIDRCRHVDGRALGVCCSAGYYVIALMATVLTVIPTVLKNI